MGVEPRIEARVLGNSRCRSRGSYIARGRGSSRSRGSSSNNYLLLFPLLLLLPLLAAVALAFVVVAVAAAADTCASRLPNGAHVQPAACLLPGCLLLLLRPGSSSMASSASPVDRVRLCASTPSWEPNTKAA